MPLAEALANEKERVKLKWRLINGQKTMVHKDEPKVPFSPFQVIREMAKDNFAKSGSLKFWMPTFCNSRPRNERLSGIGIWCIYSWQDNKFLAKGVSQYYQTLLTFGVVAKFGKTYEQS